MNTLVRNRRDFPWRRFARQALIWWLAELVRLLPGGLRLRLAGRPSKSLRLDFAPNQATLIIQARNLAAPTIIPVGLAGRQPTLAAHQMAGAPVEIRLDEVLLFRSSIELPIAAEASLESILRHQLERLVPLDPETLCFTWRIMERLPVKNRLKIELVIAKRAVLDRATGLARSLGLEPYSIVADSGDHPQATIWRAPMAMRIAPRERILRRGLEFAATSFALAAYALLVWHLDARRAALRDAVTDLQARTASMQILAGRAQTAERTLAEINGRLSMPAPLAILDALTRAVPLDGSISEFHLQNGRVEIVGTASHATTLLNIVSQLPLFENPTFMAPITTGAGGVGERYQLGFQLKAASKS